MSLWSRQNGSRSNVPIYTVIWALSFIANKLRKNFTFCRLIREGMLSKAALQVIFNSPYYHLLSL